jgi:diguanylate cyclase (GGDEF)-like protein
MSGTEILLAAIGLIVVVALALLIGPTFVWLRTTFFGRRRDEPRVERDNGIDLRLTDVGPTNGTVAPEREAEVEPTNGHGPVTEGAGHDRMIRIVSWAFLMAVAVFAAASGVWVATLPAIVILVAVTGEILVILQDILPTTRLRTARGPLQAVLAIGFASVLVALTGGLDSPFTFAFPLIVGAGALLAAPRVALVLALIAAASYLGAGLVGSPEPTVEPLVQLMVNMTGLFLLAYVGASVGRQQRQARDAAIRMSTTDAVTGLFTRAHFFTALERELARGDRSGRAFCLIMLDLDDLKSINDRAGHHVGDQVLRDVAARYGGDEFVVLLPETDPTGGWVLAEKIRQTVAEQGMPGLERGPTVSVGVVAYPTDGRTADALLVSADRAMYASKRAGKNRVARVSESPVAAAEGERGG